MRLREFSDQAAQRLCSKIGGDDGNRTHDPLLAGQVLSQLSYTPTGFFLTSLRCPFGSLKIEQHCETFLSSCSLSRSVLNYLRYDMPVTACPCLHRKEVIQPHLPIRLPCYDLTPIIEPTFDSCLRLLGQLTGFGCSQLSWFDGRCVQSPGTYSPRYADPRLLAIPTSCRRVAACNPNWDDFYGFRSTSRSRFPLFSPL